MEAYTSTLSLLTDSLTASLIGPHNALASHLKKNIHTLARDNRL